MLQPPKEATDRTITSPVARLLAHTKLHNPMGKLSRIIRITTKVEMPLNITSGHKSMRDLTTQNNNITVVGNKHQITVTSEIPDNTTLICSKTRIAITEMTHATNSKIMVIDKTPITKVTIGNIISSMDTIGAIQRQTPMTIHIETAG